MGGSEHANGALVDASLTDLRTRPRRVGRRTRHASGATANGITNAIRATGVVTGSLARWPPGRTSRANWNGTVSRAA